MSLVPVQQKRDRQNWVVSRSLFFCEGTLHSINSNQAMGFYHACSLSLADKKERKMEEKPGRLLPLDYAL